jgi:hypothetical protein
MECNIPPYYVLIPNGKGFIPVTNIRYFRFRDVGLEMVSIEFCPPKDQLR